MIETVAYILEYYGRKREIYDRETNQLYLTRYYLFLKDRKNFPFNIFLHRFHKSDDPILHDHPWNYITFIVKGGYWEWVPEFNDEGFAYKQHRIWRGPGHFRFCKATSFHRIELEPSVQCWTLFMPGPHTREWGFLVKGKKWVQHEQYLKERYEQAHN